MTTLRKSSLAVVLGMSLILSEPSYAIFGIFKKDRDRVPTKAEVAQHDREATGWFAAGEQAQKAGDPKKALDYYDTITSKYYFSQYAPEAVFRSAELLLALGEPQDAFEKYQTLIDRYRSSPRFQRAVEQQYNIAVQSLTEKQSSFLGLVPRKVSRDRVIEMFGTIITNAPASIYAANSQYYIARIHEGRKQYDEAIAAFQKVVDDYPRSQKAPQAQLKIGEIYEKTARRPDNPTNLRESREAYEDFITNFPEHQKQSDAFAQLNAIDEKEAKKSLKVAKYYEKRGNLKASAIYYKDVLRSENAALKLEARQAIDNIAKVDPEALTMAKIDENVTESAPAERLKNQPNYLGPPAPDAISQSSEAPEKPLLLPSTLDPTAIPVGEEPELPSLPSDGDAGIEIDSLIPSPPPPTESDILGEEPDMDSEELDIESEELEEEEEPDVDSEEPDTDSLLPPIEPDAEEDSDS